MAKFWVLVANSAVATIYCVQRNQDKKTGLVCVEKLQHDASKLKNSDLLADHPGHYNSTGLPRGEELSHNDPKTIEADKFAKQVADYLIRAKVNRKYEKLIVAAEPSFYGLLSKHFDEHIITSLYDVVQKEYTALNERELYDMLVVAAA